MCVLRTIHLSSEYSCQKIFLPASWYVGSDWTARIVPKPRNPLALEWQDQPFEIRSILLSEFNDGRGLALLVDIGKMVDNDLFRVSFRTYSKPSLRASNCEICAGKSERGYFASSGPYRFPTSAPERHTRQPVATSHPSPHQPQSHLTRTAADHAPPRKNAKILHACRKLSLRHSLAASILEHETGRCC